MSFVGGEKPAESSMHHALINKLPLYPARPTVSCMMRTGASGSGKGQPERGPWSTLALSATADFHLAGRLLANWEQRMRKKRFSSCTRRWSWERGLFCWGFDLQPCRLGTDQVHSVHVRRHTTDTEARTKVVACFRLPFCSRRLSASRARFIGRDGRVRERWWYSHSRCSCG
jgi:hypothetical protein